MHRFILKIDEIDRCNKGSFLCIHSDCMSLCMYTYGKSNIVLGQELQDIDKVARRIC